MNLVLYYAPMACSLVPYVTLTEAGAQFSVRNVDTRRGGTRTAEYLLVNPKGKVPVLVVDGHPLSENMAIQVWIARQFPRARLLPEDPWKQAQALSLMAWCCSGIHPNLAPNAWPQRYCDLPGSEESVKRLACARVQEDFRIADGLLAGREWFCDHFTAVDAYFFWCFRRAGQFGIDVEPFKHCRAHFGRMLERPGVQRVIAYEREVLAAFARAAG